MNIQQVKSEISFLKSEKDFAILAHSYQSREIIESSDITGDSFKIAKEAVEISAKNIAVCGVRFMAETVKILNPKKRVFLVNPSAGCPMAEQITPEQLEHEKKSDPGRTVVAYINTTGELKKKCDICVTSSSAENTVKKLESKKILFLPDPQLGSFVKKLVPEKDFKFIGSGCPVHTNVTAEDAIKAKSDHPNALMLVHPECLQEVTELADYIGSTAGIMEFAKKSQEKEFIIGTEISITDHLNYDLPEKKFYCLSKKLICPDMKLTTLMDLWNVLKGVGGEEIIMTEDDIKLAEKCVKSMLK